VKIVSGDREYEDALSVRRQVFIEEQHVPKEIEIDEFENTATHFVAYDGGKPVGAGRCRRIKDNCKVERICVLPSHRKRRVGEAIMKEIEQFAADDGMRELRLNSQSHAKNFYLRLGYEPCSDEFLEADIPHIAMRKTLHVSPEV
jgi:predicted GNAT family N-acyltransferase